MQKHSVILTPQLKTYPFFHQSQENLPKGEGKKKASSEALPSLMFKAALTWAVPSPEKGQPLPFPPPKTLLIHPCGLASTLHTSIRSSDGLPRCQSQIIPISHWLTDTQSSKSHLDRAGWFCSSDHHFYSERL